MKLKGGKGKNKRLGHNIMFQLWGYIRVISFLERLQS